jgi:hypothetical protein
MELSAEDLRKVYPSEALLRALEQAIAFCCKGKTPDEAQPYLQEVVDCEDLSLLVFPRPQGMDHALWSAIWEGLLQRPGLKHFKCRLQLRTEAENKKWQLEKAEIVRSVSQKIAQEIAKVNVQNIQDAKNTAVARYLMAPEAHDRPAVTTCAVSSKPAQDVIGVGMGRRTAKGKGARTPCITLYVERKLPKAAIPEKDLLPDQIAGIPTAVIEAGRLFASSSRQRPAKNRPARPGDSIGFEYPDPRASWLMAGTFGALARRGEDLLILSNNHVLALENQMPLDSPVFQPGLLDGGDRKRDTIALLKEFVPLRGNVANEVDCALAKVLDPRSVLASFRRPVGALKSAQPIEPTDGMSVVKVGRTTGYTKGVIFDTSADFRVQYPELGNLLFQNQILIRGDKGAFSAPGDSGAIIVDPKSKGPVALLFGGSPAFTVATPLSKVLSVLGVTICIT